MSNNEITLNWIYDFQHTQHRFKILKNIRIRTLLQINYNTLFINKKNKI